MNKLNLKSLCIYGLASLLLLSAPVYDAAADLLAVADSSSVTVFETSDNSLITTITDISPRGVKFSPDGSRLYLLGIPTQSQFAELHVYDTKSFALTSATSIGFVDRDLAVSPDGSRAYIVRHGPGCCSIEFVDTLTDTIVDSVTVPGVPFRLGLSPDGSLLYVSLHPASIAAIDTASATLITTIPLGFAIGNGGDVAFSPDGSRAYYAENGADRLFFINTASHTLIDSLAIGNNPAGVAVSLDGSRIYVSRAGRTGILLIDASAHSTITSIRTVSANWELALSPDGTRLYGGGLGDISVIDTSLNTVVGSFPGPGVNIAVGPTPASDVDGDGVPDLSDPCPADPLDECNPAGSAASEATTDEGGTVETPDGQLELEIDPGDLAEDTTISVTETVGDDPEVDLSIGANAGLGQALAFYDLEPDGLQFDSPITLNIVVDVTALNSSQRANLDVYRFEDTDMDGIQDTFVSLMAMCNVTQDPMGTFIADCSVQVDHFSSFIIATGLDSDIDGVLDDFDGKVDVCPDTAITEGVPTVSLGTNRWALVDDDFEFDTTAPNGNGPGLRYSTTDTAGCSCEQIIAEQGLGKGHTKFGCSISAMDDWVDLVN